MNGTLDSYMDSLDQIAASIDEDYEYKGTIDKTVLGMVLEELKQSNYTLPDDIKETGIDEYKIIPASITGYKDRIIHEANKSDTKKAFKMDLKLVRKIGRRDIESAPVSILISLF